jgi:hypothetical protein
MKQKLACGLAAIALAVFLAAPAGAQLATYSQDFEGLDQMDPGALTADGWLVFGNVFAGGTGNYLYGYGPFPAPNGGAGFCGIDAGQGGTDQGDQQLVTYSDYNNGDHAFGNWIEANVFQEQFVGAGDVGSNWVFSFDAKRGNINDPNDPNCAAGCATTAIAFIKTLDPNAGYALTNFFTIDTTDLPDAWARYELSIDIDDSLPGQILQVGFSSTATLYQPAGVFYDNINFEENVCNQDPTVTINGCDSGVANQDLDTCTMNDAIYACAEGAIHHGAFVACVAQLTNDWKAQDLISSPDKGSIMSCVARDRSTVVYREIRETPNASAPGGTMDVQLQSGGSSVGNSQRARGKK